MYYWEYVNYMLADSKPCNLVLLYKWPEAWGLLVDSSLYKGSISIYFWLWDFLYHSTDLDEPYNPVTSVFLISEQ